MYPPGFVINNSHRYETGEEEDWLQFSTYDAPYLKPEEVGRAVVSEPFEFHPSTISDGMWKDSNVRTKFSDCLINVIQPYYGTMKVVNRRHKQMRLVLCRLAEAKGTTTVENEEDDSEVPKVPMKLKLISNLPNSERKEEKELSYITRLANGFGHQNLMMTLEFDEDGPGPLVLPGSVDLTWNQEDLVWEAEIQVEFNEFVFEEDFGRTDRRFYVNFPKITVQLMGTAVSTLLNQQFGLYGNSEHALRTLEEEVNTDLIINAKDGNSVKCHRFPLMSASAQFVNMLNETRTWKEASTRTINLDLSKEAVMAMLHFIYYGGTDRIVSGSATQAMDLLQFGHMYELQNLVEVTSLVLMQKDPDSFSLDEGWELLRYSGGMMELEKNYRWSELKEKGRDVVKNCRYNDKNCVKMKASELYKKLCPIAENLGLAFLAFLNKTACTSADDKALPINLKEVSMEDCKLFLEYLSASWDNYNFDADLGLGFMLLVEHTQCRSLASYWAQLKELETLNKKPNTWFKVDHLVTLFTLSWEMEDSSLEQSTLMLDFARKLKWFVLNRHDEVLESTKYQELFKNNWACAMGFTKLCIQDTQVVG